MCDENIPSQKIYLKCKKLNCSRERALQFNKRASLFDKRQLG